MEPEDVVKTFCEIETVLNDGGIFVFDVCTIKNSELYFANHSMIENFGHVRCERLCKYNRAKKIQENHFIIQKGGVRRTESHFQRIYRLDEIDSLMILDGTDRTVQNRAYMRRGDRVMIMEGPLKGLVGFYLSHKGRSDRVVVNVDLLHRSLAVEIEDWALEKR